jgi:deoxyribose-phosphate aldolase
LGSKKVKRPCNLSELRHYFFLAINQQVFIMAVTREQLTQLVSWMDLTSLGDEDTPAKIQTLCAQAITPLGAVAAVCIYPQFVRLAKQTLSDLGAEQVKVATVVNFPDGSLDLERVMQETAYALREGADEIDLVMPYQAFHEGHIASCEQVILACRQRLSGQKLKVILESGSFTCMEALTQATQLAIAAGADMVKTSTGKSAVHATLEAVSCMAQVIKQHDSDSVGLKVSGGVRTVEEALRFVHLVTASLGSEWPQATRFRFGASSLLQSILKNNQEIKG